MTEITSPALLTALAYYEAWTGHDLDKAMSYIAGDIAPGAECVTVTDGKITYSRFVFDRAPFAAARQAAQ
jgi:hypothetical protein